MATSDDLRVSADEVADLEAANAGLRAASAQQQATIAQLQADLLDCQTPEPEPSPVESVFGAYAQPQSKQAWDSYVASVGPAKVTRLFYGIGSSYGGGTMPPPGVVNIASLHSRTFGSSAVITHAQVANGAIDAGVVKFAEQWKAYYLAHPEDLGLMSFVAEPDVAANTKYGPAADYVKAYLRVRQKFDAVVKAKWALILTGSTFAIDNADRNPGMWWHDSFDYVGIDPYNMGYTDGTWKASLRGETTKAREFADAHGGKGVIVPEFGSVWHDTDPNRRAGWVTEQGKVFSDLGVEYVSYFNADKTGESGNQNDHRDFRLTRAAEVAAYRAILEA